MANKIECDFSGLEARVHAHLMRSDDVYARAFRAMVARQAAGGSLRLVGKAPELAADFVTMYGSAEPRE